MVNKYLAKEPKTLNGEILYSSINGVGKIGESHSEKGN